jgi:hypothetical protein
MSLAQLVIFANLITFTPAPANRQEIAARYVASCGGARALEPDCKRLQWQLEGFLYDDLRAGAAATPETWRIAAAADVPMLAVMGLRRVGDGYTASDDEIIAAQADSPYVMVRDAAFDLAERMASDRVRRLIPRRAYGHRPAFPIAGEIPAVERLGAPVAPGAT